MRVPGIHPPDPNDPKGMAFIFAAGFCDPRPGGYPKNLHPNQALVVKQAWEPTSKMYWDLGMRYHPELATKWVEGGGQFTIGKIVDKMPDEPDIEQLAKDMAADQFSQMLAEVERVKKHGTPYEKKRLKERFQQAGVEAMRMAEMIDSAVEEAKD